MDVKTAFLNGYLKEEVYVEKTPGFEDHTNPDYVYKLDKALYGLKQAPRAWYDRLSQYLIKKGYKRGKVDNTLFTLQEGSHILLVQVYVDDIIFGSTNPVLVSSFEKTMATEFKMSMIGELTFFLGLQVVQGKDGIRVHQKKYLNEVVKKYGMSDSKAFSTPLSPNTKIDSDEKGTGVDQRLYRGIIGSLLYVAASRPDIMFSVCVCARFQVSPKESHLKAVKRILRYLKGTEDLCLFYPKKCPFNLVGYTDADYAQCTIDRKSTSGMAQFLGPCLVSWASKKQQTVALSTAEAEYVAAASCCAQLLWLRQQLSDYDLTFNSIPIMCDNTSAINISKNPVQHARTKHIEIRHHFLRDNVEKKLVEMKYIGTSNQIADIFTKALNREPFESLRLQLGMIMLD
jgi:hypothetical protein